MVTIKVISVEGLVALTLPASEALLELNRLHAIGKWIYIDGQLWRGNQESFTEQGLLAADDITVTQRLAAG